MSKNKAVILLSGGLDSATTLAIARNDGFDCMAMSFHYGQKHAIELDSARRIAEACGAAEHRIINISPAAFEGSALTDPNVAVPKGNTDFAQTGRIPITYVPARNTIFLSYALAWAEVLGASDIFIGVNQADYSGYPDCRAEFIAAFEKMANLATAAADDKKTEYNIHTPIIKLSKGEIIRRGTELGVDYSLTHSCYEPNEKGLACGKCDSCSLRLKGFAKANLTDPVKYI
jgi:7-cyano-7-deazaguanine synthase